MKKQLLLGALFLGSVVSVNAQVIYEGTFNDEAALEGWVNIDADGDGNTWETFTGDADTDSWGLSGNWAGSRSWEGPLPGTALTPDNYLISPFVTLPEGTSTLTFTAGHTYYAAADGNPEELSVYVTTAEDPDAGEISASTAIFNEVFDTPYPQGTAPVASQKVVDLSDYAGQTIKIAFRHHNSNNQELLLLDDVTVIQGVLGVNEVLASQFSVYPNPSNDVVNISNAENILVKGITVTDLNGRTVKTIEFNGVSEAQINISDLSAGVYMMNVSSDKGNITKKIIKN